MDAPLNTQRQHQRMRQLCDTACRLRRQLLQLRDPMIETIREETTTVMQTARPADIDMLDALPSAMTTALHHPESA